MAYVTDIKQLAETVKRFESRGDYLAKNPNSSASGAYQFVDRTWRRYADARGFDTNIYPTARSAPPEVQDAVFAQAVKTNGLNDWTCPGCNTPLTNFLESKDP